MSVCSSFHKESVLLLKINCLLELTLVHTNLSFTTELSRICLPTVWYHSSSSKSASSNCQYCAFLVSCMVLKVLKVLMEKNIQLYHYMWQYITKYNICAKIIPSNGTDFVSNYLVYYISCLLPRPAYTIQRSKHKGSL